MASADEIDTACLELANVNTPTKTSETFLVSFDPTFDRENPKDWSAGKKWTVTDVLSATGFNRIMVSTIMAPALTSIAKDLHMSSVESVMALSVYLLATAFGPVVIGPLSEVYGRKPILHFSNIWFLIWNLVCGFANNKGTLIAARFLAGFGASAIYSLAGGVLSDVWRPEQRGKSLGMYLLIPLLGAAVGPIIGGFIADWTTWRWIFWSTSAFQAIMVVASYFAFHETYAPLILHRRAEMKRKETGNNQYYTISERQDADQTPLQVVGRSLTRPLRLLLFHPLIQILAIQSAFDYGLLYIVLSSFADLWVKQYHESTAISGLHYIAIAIGEILGAIIGAPLLDRLYENMRKHQMERDPSSMEGKPEFRIPAMLPGAILAPIGFVIYGWAAQYSIQWAVVDVGMLILCFGLQTIGQPSQAYLIDSYLEHTSSATAAVQFLRSLTAFAFPLSVPSMFRALGYGWGNSLLALLTAAIGFVMPAILWIYGPQLRARARSSY